MSAINSHSVVLPSEPTEEMLLAAMSRHRRWVQELDPASVNYWAEIYRAMLAAAPKSNGPDGDAHFNTGIETAARWALTLRVNGMADAGLGEALAAEIRKLKREPSSEAGADDAALLDWAETHPEEAMRLLTMWWATAGRGCRETRFEFRNIFRSGQSATLEGGKNG